MTPDRQDTAVGGASLDAPDALAACAERRARLAEQLGDGVAIFGGARLVRRVHDVDHIFRQQSDLLYLTGFSHPDAVAVLGPGSRFILFVQPKDRSAETWTGRRPGVEGAVEQFGADEAHPIGELQERLPELIDGAGRLYHRLGEDEALDRVVVGALKHLRARARRGALPPELIADPYPLVHEMRLRKSPYEISLMRRAQEITRDAHRAAARLARPGAFEFELEAALAHVFRSRGGSGPAYPSIVAAGENATILHYTENQSRIEPGDAVLIDAGVEYGGYAADVTRTYPAGGAFSAPAADVYGAVLRAQREAIAAVRPGASLRSMHDVAVRSLSASLVDLGVLKGSVDEIVQEERYKPYYMHQTGHYLGLDVHDVGATLAGGEPRPLEPGMVLTVEPGLYMSRDDETCPVALRGIGVRIEDDVLVTEQGCRVLSDEVPKEVDDLRAWMNG